MATTITLTAQLAEVRREIAMRRRVYPRWVQGGKMAQHAANNALATMEAVAATLTRLVDAEKAQTAPELF